MSCDSAAQNPGKPRGLFINCVAASCSIYESGVMFARALAGSDCYELSYLETDQFDAITADFDFYVFNYHHLATPWLDPRRIAELPGRHIAFVLEIARDNPFVLCPDVFDEYCVPDPTLQCPDPRVHAFGRPLEIGDDLPKYVPGDVPVIGSFGFATPGKGFEMVVHGAGREFERAVVRLNIPAAKHADASGELTRAIRAACERVVRPGIDLQIEHRYLDKRELIEWCSKNTLNVFLYDRNLPGLAATTDQAIASGRPLLVSPCDTFRHIHPYITPYPRLSFREAIETAMPHVVRMQADWHPLRFRERFEQIVRRSAPTPPVAVALSLGGRLVSVLIVSEPHDDPQLELTRLVGTVHAASRSLGRTPHELLVLDRHARDADGRGVLQQLRTAVPECTVVSNPTPCPLGARFEFLRENARGDVLCVLASGTLPAPGALSALVDAVHNGADIAEPRFVDATGASLTAQAATGCTLVLNASLWPLGRLRESPFHTAWLWADFVGRATVCQVDTVVVTDGWSGRAPRQSWQALRAFDRARLSRRAEGGDKTILLAIDATVAECLAMTGVVASLQARHPDARIDVLTDRASAWVFAANQHVHQIFTVAERTVDDRIWQLDLAVEHVYAAFQFDRLYVFTAELEPGGRAATGQRAEDYFAAQVGVEASALHPVELGAEPPAGDYVVVHARGLCAGRTPHHDLLRELTNHLVEIHGLPVHVVDDPHGLVLDRDCANHCPATGSGPEAAALAAGARLVIGPEGAPLQAAANVGVPQLVLRTGTDRDVAPAAKDRVIIVEGRDVDANTCRRHVDALLDDRAGWQPRLPGAESARRAPVTVLPSRRLHDTARRKKTWIEDQHGPDEDAGAATEALWDEPVFREALATMAVLRGQRVAAVDHLCAGIRTALDESVLLRAARIPWPPQESGVLVAVLLGRWRRRFGSPLTAGTTLALLRRLRDDTPIPAVLPQLAVEALQPMVTRPFDHTHADVLAAAKALVLVTALPAAVALLDRAVACCPEGRVDRLAEIRYWRGRARMALPGRTDAAREDLEFAQRHSPQPDDQFMAGFFASGLETTTLIPNPEGVPAPAEVE